jgi:hypothetical protein
MLKYNKLFSNYTTDSYLTLTGAVAVTLFASLFIIKSEPGWLWLHSQNGRNQIDAKSSAVLKYNKLFFGTIPAIQILLILRVAVTLFFVPLFQYKICFSYLYFIIKKSVFRTSLSL